MYDPLTGDLNGVGRTAFPGNRIPADRISPIARNIINRIPLPNLTDASEINNYFASVRFAANNWMIDSKSNWFITQNLNVFGSISLFDFGINNPTAFGESIDGARVGGGNAGMSHRRNTRLSFGANKIFTPTMLMDAFFGFNRRNTNVEPPGLGRNCRLEELGIPGANGPGRFQSGRPHFSIAGYAAIGGGASMGARGRFKFGVGSPALCITSNARCGCAVLCLRPPLIRWQAYRRSCLGRRVRSERTSSTCSRSQRAHGATASMCLTAGRSPAS